MKYFAELIQDCQQTWSTRAEQTLPSYTSASCVNADITLSPSLSGSCPTWTAKYSMDLNTRTDSWNCPVLYATLHLLNFRRANYVCVHI